MVFQTNEDLTKALKEACLESDRLRVGGLTYVEVPAERWIALNLLFGTNPKISCPACGGLIQQSFRFSSSLSLAWKLCFMCGAGMILDPNGRAYSWHITKYLPNIPPAPISMWAWVEGTLVYPEAWWIGNQIFETLLYPGDPGEFMQDAKALIARQPPRYSLVVPGPQGENWVYTQHPPIREEIDLLRYRVDTKFRRTLPKAWEDFIAGLELCGENQQRVDRYKIPIEFAALLRDLNPYKPRGCPDIFEGLTSFWPEAKQFLQRRLG